MNMNMNPMNQIFMNNQMNMFNLQEKNIQMHNMMNNQMLMHNMMMNNNIIPLNNMMINNNIIPINNMMMNNNIPINNMMMNNNMPINNMMMNNQMLMNNLMDMQMLKNNQIMTNNLIQNKNSLIKNDNNFKNHKKRINAKREIPPILQKNANKNFETITFQVEKGLKPYGNLEKTNLKNIFSSIFTKQKTEIDSKGKLKYLKESEPMEILHYKFNINEKEFFSYQKKSLIQGLILAYKNHYPITISPDMIWLLILQGFSRFMDKYHELVREKFVNFDGQKTLYINRYETPVKYATEETWDGIIDECVEQIGENIGVQTISNLQADFSTTNAATLLASQASIMSAMKHYFKFEVLMGGCGISSITLEGSIEDWEKIKTKLKYLSNYALKWWTKNLIPIIDNIIITKKYYEKYHNINNELINFWKTMIRTKGKGDLYNPLMINGWIIKFIPNLNDIHPKLYDELKENDVPDQILNCPLKIVEDSSIGFKIEYECGISSGFFGMIQDKKTLNVKPVIGYAIVVENKKKLPMTLQDKEEIIKNYFS